MNRDQFFSIVDLLVQVGSGLVEAERANRAAAAATAATTAAVNSKVNCSLCGQPCRDLRYEGVCGQICEYCLDLGARQMIYLQSRLRSREDSRAQLRAELASRPAARSPNFSDIVESLASVPPAAPTGTNAPGRDRKQEVKIGFLQAVTGCVVPVTVDDGAGVRTLDVKVRPGIKDGTRLRLRGQGGAGEPPGDVLVTVRVEPPRVDRTRADQMQNIASRLAEMEAQGMPQKGSA